jgi:hypothetical protein
MVIGTTIYESYQILADIPVRRALLRRRPAKASLPLNRFSGAKFLLPYLYFPE